MDISKAIRTAFFKALDGNILIGGNPVPVVDSFDIADSQPDYPYIVLGAQEASQRTAKNRRPYNALINIDVVTGFMRPEGREQSEDIQEAIDNIVNPESRVMIDASPNGWEIGDILQQNSTYLTNRNKLFYIYRKITSYSLIVTRV